jgi:hypothetical protein
MHEKIPLSYIPDNDSLFAFLFYKMIFVDFAEYINEFEFKKLRSKIFL